MKKFQSIDENRTKFQNFQKIFTQIMLSFGYKNSVFFSYSTQIHTQIFWV